MRAAGLPERLQLTGSPLHKSHFAHLWEWVLGQCLVSFVPNPQPPSSPSTDPRLHLGSTGTDVAHDTLKPTCATDTHFPSLLCCKKQPYILSSILVVGFLGNSPFSPSAWVSHGEHLPLYSSRLERRYDAWSWSHCCKSMRHHQRSIR